MTSLGTHPVEIALAPQSKTVVRATVSENIRHDQLLRAVARRLVETGSVKVPLVKALQKFHYVKCNCTGGKLTGTPIGDLEQDCMQEQKINLSDFAEFGEYTDGCIDITFKKAAYAKAAKKVGTDGWTIRLLNTSPAKDGGEDSLLPPTFRTKFVPVTLLACEPGESADDLVLSFATAGDIFHVPCKNGVLLDDVMAQIHKMQKFDPDVAVKLVTKDGALLEPSDEVSATLSRWTKEVSDLIPRLKIRAVLGVATHDPEEDRLRDSFVTWDADGNGEISASEMAQIFAKLDPGLDTVSLFTMLAEADVNKDGALDYDEFVSWLLK